MSDFYKDAKVSNSAINAFFKRTNISGEVHTLHVLHGGNTVIRIAPAPYKADDKRESYSLSKSFASTAIGMLVTEGKLSLNERIVDLFPDKCPTVISENLSKMRLRHVLSMNTGHSACVMSTVAYAEDPVRAFLAEEVPYEPGTHFAYNTGATCLLSCIVEKLTGMRLINYITAKLFIPLGIKNVRWLSILDGQNQGGCGIHVSCDDLVKLGQLYLNGGIWNGKRYLSEEWIREATSPISDNSSNGTIDWCSGYGFQFWCNAKEGYRGDGAFGQLLVVFPERDMVVAVQGLLGDMQGELDSIYDLTENMYMESDEPLELPIYAPASSDKKTAGLEDKFYTLRENPAGLTGMYLTYDSNADAICINFSDGSNVEEVRAGNGHWEENVIFVKKLTPNLSALQPTPSPVRTELSASYSADSGKLDISVRFRSSPHPTTWTFTGDGENIRMNIEPHEFMEEGTAELIGKIYAE